MAEPVKVYILDREYLVACPDDQKSSLMQSAVYLNRRMQEIRDKGKVVGIDRIAVMAALNITHELLCGRDDSTVMDELRDRLQALDAKLSAAIESP
jgi:cell division protein ZapA